MTKNAQVSYIPSSSDIYDNISASYKNKKLISSSFYVCDEDADYFINPETEDDNNTGLNMENAFKTLNKALKVIEAHSRLYLKGEINNTTPFVLSTSCSVYCTKGSKISSQDYIFEIKKNVTLLVKNKGSTGTMYINNGSSKFNVLNSN